MSIALNEKSPAIARALVNGDRMLHPEFHRRYETYPDDIKFELVGGIVYLGPAITVCHSNYASELLFALGLYHRATCGVESLPRATIILGEKSEPQPDLSLRILPEYGGQSRNTADDYLEGPPELLAEIAYSTRAIEMHQKRRDYRLAGVAEYLVVCIEEQELHWFDFKGRRAIRPQADGISRSRVFPGLWIDVAALLALDSARLKSVVAQGLASEEHAAFVKQLRKRR